MTTYLGIIFALLALVSWGFGDFFIQRSARKFGDWESIFAIELTGLIILFPFVARDVVQLPIYAPREIAILLAVAITFFISSFLGVESLKRGKLSVVESVGAIEIIVAGIISYFIFSEVISSQKLFFILIVIFGILLVALKPHHLKKETWIEKGAILGLFGSLLMGLTDFMVGFGSREVSPLLAIWVTCAVMAFLIAIYFFSTGRISHFLKDSKKNFPLMVSVGILDNFAWLSFAFATLFVPIVIALALSESYIILATLLGIYINREKLFIHQIAGILLAITGVIVISIFYS